MAGVDSQAEQGWLRYALGLPGGRKIFPSALQALLNLIDHGMNVQMTTDVARFTHNQDRNVLSLEQNLFALVGDALKEKGHDVRAVDGGAVGGYQGILFTPDPRLPAPSLDPKSTRPIRMISAASSRKTTKIEPSTALR